MVFFALEAPHEICLGEWQDTPHAIVLCAVLRVNRGELSTRYRGAVRLLQSQMLRRSLQNFRFCTPRSCDGIMISPMFLGAAAILLISLATSAMAQQVISEPGYCAQFYPNANCQNKGPNNPYTGDYQHRNLRSNSCPSNGVCAQGAAFYLDRDGRRHT
jgi:hypothetical protein